MTLKIDVNIIKSKIEKYIQEIEELKKTPYPKGQDKMYSIDANIKSFLTVAFENSKERNRDYQGIIIAGGELSPEKEQKYYLMDLDSRLRTLNAWKEEMKLIIEVSKDVSKVDKIQEQIKEEGISKVDKIKDQIEEKGLESKRREKVAETKFYGAVIELLDFQRNMLKDKEESTKHLITLQKDVQDLKEKVNKILFELVGKE